MNITVEDLIEGRRCVLRFYRGVLGVSHEQRYNVISRERPYYSAASDIQVMMYLKMALIGREYAAQLKEFEFKGKEKHEYLQMEQNWGRIECCIPKYNNKFLFVFSDVDEEIEEMFGFFKVQVLSTISNKISYHNVGLSSETLLKLSLIQSASVFTNIGIKTGMITNHELSARCLADYVKHTDALLQAAIESSQCDYPKEEIEQFIREASTNVWNKVDSWILGLSHQLAQMDLTRYIATADFTMEYWQNQRSRLIVDMGHTYAESVAWANGDGERHKKEKKPEEEQADTSSVSKDKNPILFKPHAMVSDMETRSMWDDFLHNDRKRKNK